MNAPGKKIPCSVEVLTRNSAQTLARCLASVKDFAEIIVLDGNSADATREIAARYGCKIYKQYDTDEPLVRITDFSAVRNKGLRLASHDWFMFIDADEHLSPEAVSEIREIVGSQTPPARVFWQPRKYVLDGRIIECATTYPNRQIRFFHRGAVDRFVKPIHERILVKPDAAPATLHSVEYVPLEPLAELTGRWARYIDAEILMHRNDSPGRLVRHAVRSLALFSLYALRYVRNFLFCRGPHLPFSYEWGRHRYTLKLSYLLSRQAIKKIFQRLFLKKNIFSKFMPIAFLFAMVIILFSPLLFSGNMIAGEEDVGAYYPMIAFYQKAIQNSESFLWNNFYYGGFPSYVNILGGFFYPLHYFLFKILPLFLAYHLAIVIPVFLGSLFSYLFGRANSFSRTGSLILALSYTLSQTMDGLTTTLSYANGFMVIPALFYFILKLKQAGNVQSALVWLLFGTAITGIGFLAGFSQLVLYGFTFVFLYALFWDWHHRHDHPQGGVWRRHSGLIGFVLVVAAGALCAAPQILSSLQFADISVRTPHYAEEVSIYPSLGYFLTFLFPDSVRIPFLVTAIPGLYIGVLPLLFAIAGTLFFRTAVSRFFIFSYFFMFALAVNIPVISWINTKLPLFSRISHTGRWFLIGAFALSFLASHGFEELRKKPPEWFRMSDAFRRFLRIIGWAIVLIVFSLVAANAVLYFLSFYPEFKIKLLEILLSYRSLNSSLPFEHYLNVFDRVIADALSSISLLHWRFLVPLILFPVSFFVLKFLAKLTARSWFAPASLVLVTLNIFVAFAAFYQEFVPSSVLEEKPAVAKAIVERENDLSSFRFMPFLTGEALFRELFSKRRVSASDEAFLHKEVLTNQIGAFYGIQNMQGFEPLRSLRQNQLVDTLLAPHTMTIFDKGAVREASLEEKTSDFIKRIPLLSMMNVKYIVSVYPLRDGRLTEIPLEVHKDFFLPLHLYENKDVMPRVYFAKRPVYWQGDDRGLLVAMAEKSDFQSETFIECSGCIYPARDPGKNTLEILRYAPGVLMLSAGSEKGGWLVFSESNLPGWISEIDGRRVPIYTANYLFQSIFVPAGEHQIEFRYAGPLELFLEKVRIAPR